MQVQPYLFFEGRCDEALSFYKSALNAEARSINRFGDIPDQSMVQPQMADKIMHAELHFGDTAVLVSDGQCTGQARFHGFSLSVRATSDEEAERAFTALSDGATVQLPLTSTFFASRFGMLTDRFGVGWMVICQKQNPVT